MEDDSDRPKKKQRMSVVCLNCKTRKIKCDRKRPACSNCVKCNVGHLCQYEPPHWLSRVSHKKDNAPESPSSLAVSEVHDVPAADPQAEIQRLRAINDALQNDHHHRSNSATNSIVHREDEEDEVIDFYNSYDVLLIKRSGMVEHKPLSSIVMETNDEYFMILLGYGNLCNTYYRAQHGDIRRKPDNKKERLDGSLTHYIRLLGEYDLPQVQEVMKFFIKQRLPKYFSHEAVFPNLGTEGPLSSQTIKTQIEKVIPTIGIIKIYLERFFKYLYPFFPYISEKLFSERIFNNILTSSNDDSPITLIFEDKFDYGLLAILLIVMRITYISLPKAYDPIADPELRLLHQNPIGPEFISLALNLLSLFQILRKTKLTIVQALLYLKVYFSYSPEDSDGSELNQSQVLYGLVVQSALTIGLNRDSSFHAQLSFTKDVRNLWRRVWFGIIELDRSLTVLGGNSPAIQNVQCSNVQFPELDAEDPYIDHEMSKELKRSQAILNLFAKLAILVNNVGLNPRVSQIFEVLKQIRLYVDINYSLIDMKRLKGLDIERRIAISFINTKRVQFQLQAKSLELTILQDLSLHYESRSYSDLSRLSTIRTMVLRTLLELTNIIYSYLKTDYADYIDASHLVLLNIFIQNAYQRTISSYISTITRFYHVSDLLSRGVSGANFETKLAEEVITLLSRISAGLNTMVCNKMGRIYYQVFKQCYKYKFLLRSLENEGFKCITDTLNFLTERYSGDPGARIRLLRVVHLKTEPENALKELDNVNHLITLEPYEIQEFISYLKTALILDDSDFNYPNLVWEAGFRVKNGTENGNSSVQTQSSISSVVDGVNVGLENVSIRGNDLNQDMEEFNGSSLISLDQMLNEELFNFDSFNAGVGNSLDWLF